MEYTVPLALQDYMTVIFSAIGLFLLTHMVSQLDRTLGRMAMIGSLLTVTGGALKASGKLVMAMGGPDLPVLNLALFPLIAPGFTLVAWALYHVRRAIRGQPALPRPWLVPSVTIIIFAGICFALWRVGGPWRVPLILLSSVANIGLLFMLVLASWGRKLWVTGALFLFTLVVVLVMSQMAQIPFQSINMIWFEQVSQTIAQALFALASWQYGKEILQASGRRMVAQPA